MEKTDSRKKIAIFDTTLRDGQQCPGAGMSFEQNLRYADLACKFGVDVLEAGFPASSDKEFETVRVIGERLSATKGSPVITALCQLRPEQFEKTILSLEPAAKYGKARLHTYLPVDPELMRNSLGEQNYRDKHKHISLVYKLIRDVVAEGIEVQFSPEGYSRMGKNFSFTTDLILSAIDAGATVINCPDTIGGACRAQGEEYFVHSMQKHAEIVKSTYPDQQITWSAHCHNDMGLALDNTINAVFHGPATQIEGCINGIGERAGNVSLEQCCMYIHQFASMHSSGSPAYTGVDLTMIQEISDFVDSHMLPRQPHSPVSGSNAARHTSGGHTNAILKNPTVYQPYDPKLTGKAISLLFGPSSGGNHARAIIEKHGYPCGNHEKAEIALYIKSRYKDRYKGITDEELMSAYFEYRKNAGNPPAQRQAQGGQHA